MSISRYYSMPPQLDLSGAPPPYRADTFEREFLGECGVAYGQDAPRGRGVNPYEVVGGNGSGSEEDDGVRGPIVYYLGAAAYDKGTTHTIEASGRCGRVGVNATFIMAGPPCSISSESIRGPRRRRARAVLVDPASSSDTRQARLLPPGRYFALPSRTDSFGIVYLEPG